MRGPNDKETFAEAIEAVHAIVGGSWEQFAHIFGLSDKTIRGWRKGTVPRATTLAAALEKASLVLASNLTDRISRAFPDPFRLLPEIQAIHTPQQVTSEIRLEQNFRPDILLSGGSQSFLAEAKRIYNFSGGRPLPPVQKTEGPTLAPTEDGFDIEPKSLPENERSNPSQISLHKRLQLMADRLQASMPAISNTHPALVQEFEDYRTFLAANLIELGVTNLWMVGTGLSEHVRALDQAAAGVMTPELEPDIKARLRTLMATHTAFILGFQEGQELLERVLRGREAAEADPDLQDKTEAVLRPMEGMPHLLAVKAVKIVRALLRGFAAAPQAAFDLITSSTEMARNGVYAFIKVLHPILVSNEAITLGAAMVGIENVNVLHAAAAFLHENHASVAALFAHDPQMADWLAWAMRRLSDSLPD